MICGAEDLIGVCKERIAPRAHELSVDGKFSWEEVECLGACSNAPMAQIGKDYYEDLTAARLGEILDEMASGQVPVPGPQNGRYASEPASGLTSLKDHEEDRHSHNASADLAISIGDTIKRIDGTEVPLVTPWQRGANEDEAPSAAAGSARDDMMPPAGPDGAQGGRTEAEKPAPRDVGDSSDKHSEAEGEAPEVDAIGHPDEGSVAPKEKNPDVEAESGHPAPVSSPAGEMAPGTKPAGIKTARGTGADDLKKIKGIGPKLERMLNDMGIYHYDQIAGWGPDEVAWVDQNLKGFKGRASRDKWVAQAGALVSGSETT